MQTLFHSEIVNIVQFCYLVNSCNSPISVLQLNTEFLVEAENDSTVTLSWRADEVAKAYYVVWCKGRKDTVHCEVW